MCVDLKSFSRDFDHSVFIMCNVFKKFKAHAMAAYLNGCGRKKKWSWKISEKDCSNGGESDCHTDLNDL